VVLKGTTALFRRLVVTPEGRFLKTLNPAWPTPIMPLPDDAVVCGTVIFSGRLR
jgi:SOS-response transcriptional repressor LexA